MSFLNSLLLQSGKPTEAQMWRLENHISDSLSFQNVDLISGWTQSMIAERRVSVLKEKDWTNAAPIYRQINLLRDVFLSLKSSKKNS